MGAQDVRVNALSPGGVLGSQDPSSCASTRRECRSGRMRGPAHLAGALLFLASDASRYVTGHELQSTEDSRHERPGGEPGENPNQARELPVSKLLGA